MKYSMSSDSPSPAQTAVASTSTQDEAEENPLAWLRSRLISVKDMTRPQRVITAIGAGALLLMAILLITDALPQPRVAAGISDTGAQLFVPTPMLIVGVPALVCIVIFAIAGALTAPWYIRLPIGFGLAALLAVEPFIELANPVTGAAAGAPPIIAAASARALQMATLIALCVFTVRGSRRTQASDDPRTWWPASAFRTALILTLAYYGLGIAAWLVVAPFTHVQVFTLFTTDVAEQLLMLPVALTIVAYWAIAGMTEWGDLAGTGLAYIASKAPRGLWLANTLLALGALVYAALQGAFSHWPALVGTAALLLVSVGAAALARPRASWPLDVPVVAVVVGAALLTVGIGVAAIIVAVVLQSSALAQNDLPVAQVGFGVVAMLLGLALAARSRAAGSVRAGAVGLFIFLVGGVFALIELASAVVALGGVAAPIPFITLYALIALAGVVALAVSVAFARNPLAGRAAGWLNATLALTIGMLGIAFLVKVVLPALAALGALSAGLTALLFLLSAVWDLATSGADVTNGGSQRFSRSTRLLLYLAYVMVAALTFAFLSAQHFANGQAPQQYLSDDSTLLPGLYTLGIPAVLLTFILRAGRAWGRRTQPGDSGHE